MAATQLPEDFRCPISLEIMTDPVILSSGHTFDRASIQRWLDAGHRTYPITKLPLPRHPTLIPNHALRSLIANFTLSSSTPAKPCGSPSGQYPHALVSTLTARSSGITSKLESLSLLVKLSKRDPAFCRRLSESGTISVVLRCIDSDDPIMRERALSLVLNLSLDDQNKVGLVVEGAIAKVVAALRGNFAYGRAIAATIITSLSVVEVNKAIIGESPFAIESLISLLRDGNGQEKKEAATALFAICSFSDNRKRAISIGAVPILLSLADSGLERAVEVLCLLAKCREGKEAMERFHGAVSIIVQVMRTGSSKGVQHALLVLYLLCCCNHRMGFKVRQQGVLHDCLSLVEDENKKIRGNAFSLVQVLAGDFLMR